MTQFEHSRSGSRFSFFVQLKGVLRIRRRLSERKRTASKTPEMQSRQRRVIKGPGRSRGSVVAWATNPKAADLKIHNLNRCTTQSNLSAVNLHFPTTNPFFARNKSTNIQPIARDTAKKSAPNNLDARKAE